MNGRQFIYHMKGLSKTYPGGQQVLKDIHLSFYPDAKIGVLGVNGAGKSTLLRIMAGHRQGIHRRGLGRRGRARRLSAAGAAARPGKDVRGNVMEGVGREEGAARPLQRDRGELFRRDRRRDGASCRTRSTRRTCGTSIPRSIWRWTRCAARPTTPTSPSSRAAKSAAWRCASCCSKRPISCCSTSRPTISTPKWWPGWKAICATIRA